MKTTTLLAAAALGLLAPALAQAQDARFIAPSTKARTANAPVKLRPRVDGSIPRAIRSGHPLQVINPLAPAEYGDGRDMVRREADDPYQRPRGLKLFVVEF